MERFHIIEDGAAILQSKGNFRQVKVYSRGTQVYAQWGGGYVRLMRGGCTSNPNVSWSDVEADGVIRDRSNMPMMATLKVVGE